MSIVRKRPLPADVEQVDSKKAERPLASGRVTRPAKRRKTEDSGDSKQNVAAAAADSKPSATAVRMKRQAWSSVAIDAFFEGLYQHGKNFHRILKYMQSKQKKLNDPVISNLTRDQVRFFYYRTWRKVESLLNDSSDSKKPKPVDVPEISPHASDGTRPVVFEEDTLDLSAEDPDGSPQRLAPEGLAFSEVYHPTGELELEEKGKEHSEVSTAVSISDKVEPRVKDTVVVNGVRQHIDLVALICYKRLKEKCSGDHNLGKKLSELVYHGTTTIPGRKRKVQIKIPNCVALRAATRKQAQGEAVAASEDQPAPEQQPADGMPESMSEPEACSPAVEEHSCCSELPAVAVVELRPRTTAAWQHVQGLAQNPRVRVTLCGSKPLSHVVQFLCQKWQLENGQEAITLYHKEATSGRMRSRSATPLPHPLPSHEDSAPSTATAGRTVSGKDERNARAEDPNEDHRKTPTDCVSTVEFSSRNVSGGFVSLHSIAAATEEQEEEEEVEGGVPTTGAAIAMAKDVTPPESGSSGSGTTLLDVQLMSCPLRDILHKFSSASRLQLLYDIPKRNVAEGEEPIGAVLKLVEYMRHRHSGVTSTPIKSPSSLRAVAAYHSPKVKQYMQALARKQSPRKSPLAKYWRLKTRSPSINTPAKRTLSASFNAIEADKDESVPNSRPSPPKRPKHSTTAAFAGIALQNVFSSVGSSKLKATPTPPPLPPAAVAIITQKLHPPAILPTPSSQTQSPTATATTPSLSLVASPVAAIATTAEGAAATSPAPARPSSSQALVTSHHIPPTITTPSAKSISMVTTLKPYSKLRRPKKTPTTIGVPNRQLVPRPLLYLPNAIAAHAPKDQAEAPTPTSTIRPVSVSPGTPASIAAAAAPKHEASITTTLINHQLLALLQTVLLQQHNNQKGVQQLKQSSQPSTVAPTAATKPVTTSTKSKPSLTSSGVDGQPVQLATGVLETGRVALDNPDNGSSSDPELQNVIFNNLLAEHIPNLNVEGSPSSKSMLFHTSSDTVNDLLRGLSATPAVVGSIERLSKETEAVLPSFAKALVSSSRENVVVTEEGPPVISGSFDEQQVEFPPPTSSDIGRRGENDEAEIAPNLDCNDDFVLLNDRLLPSSDASNESLGDFLGSFNDSNVSQRLEQIDFSDVFSQLKDMLKTPDKQQHRDESQQPHMKDGGASIGGLLDILGSPDRTKSLVKDGATNSTTFLDPTYRSLMDETSVDYIQKFKELASRMNETSS